MNSRATQLKFGCPRMSHYASHYHYGSQSIACFGQWECWTGWSQPVNCINLHKYRTPHCTAEWTYCLFPILCHYCGFPSNATSDIRSVQDSENEPAAKVPRLVTESSSSCIQISSQEYQTAFDTVLHSSSPLQCSFLPSMPVLNSCSQKNTRKNETVSFQPGAFKNCNVTINFNYM